MALLSWSVRFELLLPCLECAEQSDFWHSLGLMRVSLSWFHFLLEDQFLGPAPLPRGHSECSFDRNHLYGSFPASRDFRDV